MDMKLFKCHAVMPLVGRDRVHIVKTYVVASENWGTARARVRDEEPGAEFVTMPVETPAVQLVEFAPMSEREVADLRSACNWREEQMPRAAAPVPHAGQSTLGSKG
jgi:hypothetical protein